MLRREVTLFGVGLMLVLWPGLFIFSAFIDPFIKTRQRKDWVPVQCTVVSCEISHSSGASPDSPGDSNLHIVYNYTYDKILYTCKTIDNYPSLGQGDELAQKYKEMFCSSTPVTGYLNPDDPTEAVLHRDYFRPGSGGKRFSSSSSSSLFYCRAFGWCSEACENLARMLLNED